eukprot:5792925-Amphidinium_carterae.1
MSDLSLLNTALELEPDNAVRLAARDRLLRQARRLWELRESGAIPPLDDQVILELTVVLGLNPPDATETPLFPYADRKFRKRAIHSHTIEELRDNAEAAEARHRRRNIAPLGHALARAAEAAKRRRRILPPKRGKWSRSMQQQHRHMPLEEDPIEDFSPIETPGLASTDQLPAATTETTSLVVLADAVASDSAQIIHADTIVDSTDASSSSAESTPQGRQTSTWPELAEEEELSSGNSTVSSFSTICYTPQPHDPSSAQDDSQPAEAAGQSPSMSCVVPSALRARAISIDSRSDDDDNEPLIHLVNGTEHLSPLLLVSLLLLLQAPFSWLAWLPAAVVACPLLVTKTGLKRIQRQRRLLHIYVSISVCSSTPKIRPVHRFAGVRIGEASNPGPARQSTLSFPSTLRDNDDMLSVPMEVAATSAEADTVNEPPLQDNGLTQVTDSLAMDLMSAHDVPASFDDTP